MAQCALLLHLLLPLAQVKSLKPDQAANAILFTGLADPSLYGKVFDVFWDGDGELQLGGCSVLSWGTNTATIKLSSSGSEIPITFKITETNPQNYLRNIRVLPQGGICINRPLGAVAKQSACIPTSSYRSFKDYHGGWLPRHSVSALRLGWQGKGKPGKTVHVQRVGLRGGCDHRPASVGWVGWVGPSMVLGLCPAARDKWREKLQAWLSCRGGASRCRW